MKMITFAVTLFSIFTFDSESVEAQQCYINSTQNCIQGNNIYCANSQCRTWYFDPQTGTWGLTGNPKWLTMLRCLTPAKVLYSNAQNVPTVSPAPAGVTGGGKTSLGDQICAGFFDCDCSFAGAQVNSPCQASSLQYDIHLRKEEIDTNVCTGQK